VVFAEHMRCCCAIQQDIVGIRYATDSHEDLAYLMSTQVPEVANCKGKPNSQSEQLSLKI
jgi:hypothetical protein